MSYFKSWDLSDLAYARTDGISQVNIELIDDGFHQNENFIFYRVGSKIEIFDRVCDHQGGRLFLSNDKAVCPLHGWELDLKSHSYITANCKKQPFLVLDEHELDSPLVEIPMLDERLQTVSYLEKYVTNVSFLNHACLYFEVSTGLKFATDPWVIGSAFNNGWWLVNPSPIDVFDKLNGCDFIYISHHHPDHLHPESLKHIRKDMPILTAAFLSGSTKEILEKEGFHNLFAMDFKSRVSHPEHEISFAVLKSGDFRDDSGLLVELGEFKCLLTVDSNSLNFGKLPKSVHLLCSSFAGGSSAWPLCFKTYTEREKSSIVVKNGWAKKATTKFTIDKVCPSYFMPYAGFFTEKAPRDSYIRKNNIKHNVNDYESICDGADAQLLNVLETDYYKFVGNELVAQEKMTVDRYVDHSVSDYLEASRDKENWLDDKSIIRYFQRSAFHDPLVLELRCTSDDFKECIRSFVIDFSQKGKVDAMLSSDSAGLVSEVLNSGNRFLQINVREYELYDVIKNGKSWEDLSIGFQCRIFREPNIYNSNFWFHFANVYIGRRTSFQVDAITQKTTL